MDRAFFLLPAVLGAAAVFQALLNREVGSRLGLAQAVFINNIVFFAAGLALFVASHRVPELFPEFFRPRTSETGFRWWFVLPGILGFSLVAGAPWAVSRLGAFTVFVLFVTAQLFTSLLWDHFSGASPLTLSRVGGLILTLAGVWLATSQRP
jgi:transporter family-2 protein